MSEAAEAWRAAALSELAAAEHLASAGRYWAQTYHHAGFAVELMLKAVRMRRDRLDGWPRGDTGGRWHDLEFVAQRCRVLAEIEGEKAVDDAFSKSWDLVRDWNPSRRYPPLTVSESDARGMLGAVVHRSEGVVACLERLYARI